MSRLPEHVSFTMLPNFIFDNKLGSLSGGELKILLTIYRKTVGFGKKSDTISYSQIKKNTGLSKSTIAEGIRGLANKKLVKVDRSEFTNRYTYCLPEVNNLGSSNNELKLVRKSNNQPVRKSNTQKKIAKETEINTTSSSNLSNELRQVINCWNKIFPDTLSTDDSGVMKYVEKALDNFTVQQIKQAILMRSRSSYYRKQKPQLRNKPNAFFPYPETIANDLKRKSREIYNYQKMIDKVTSSNLTTDDFESIESSDDLWVLRKDSGRILTEA